MTIETDGSGSVAAAFVSTVFNEQHEAEGTPPEHNPENLISKCHFQGIVAFQGIVGFQGTNGTDILHAGPSLLEATEEPSCAVAGGQIEGSFTLETPDGTPVIIDHS